MNVTLLKARLYTHTYIYIRHKLFIVKLAQK